MLLLIFLAREYWLFIPSKSNTPTLNLILQSEQGFIDENSNTLNQEELQSFIEKMQKNKEDFKLSSIDRLKNMNL